MGNIHLIVRSWVDVCVRIFVSVQIFQSTNRSMASVPASGPTTKDLSYNDIIELKQKDEIILIDVRELSEIQETGKLPGSVHIPRKFLCFHLSLG